MGCGAKKGKRTEIKVIECLRILGSNCALDNIDEKSCMSAESVRYYLFYFPNHIGEMYGNQFFNRRPNKREPQRIADRYADDELVGCIGAVDCCNLLWKNCPLEEKGQYHNPKDSKLAILKIEA